MALSSRELKILQSIKVASENDPRKPEFPADKPKFPATPTYKIKIPGFNNVWFKDESQNPTGTHKDRMAWEIVVTYRDFLLAKRSGHIKGALPAMSIISSGSSAVAIQTQLNKYRLPALRTLIDKSLNKIIAQSLKKIGCKLYKTELSKKSLSSQEILALTHNLDGFDITSSEALDPTTRFYDWLSYEIINSSPDYCFIPFGTGHLYENVLNRNKWEVSTKHHDPRFFGKVAKLKECHFMGATTNDPSSLATKLYSPHLPFVHYDEQWIKLYRYAGFCGNKSNVYLLKESFLKKAIELSKSLGIEAEPSGLAGMALFLQMQSVIPHNKKILIVSTGKTKMPK